MDSLFNLDQACTFCQIAANEAEASVVYQDDHTLVIPNQHATMITEIDPNTVGHMFEIGVRIDQALRDSDLRCEAVSLYLADGAAAGQAVLHSHLHVVPRFQADSCGLHLHAGPAERANRKMLEEHAEAIRRSLESEI
jgi:histidine triad (HIT) family protein